jgi:hypothetical protein
VPDLSADWSAVALAKAEGRVRVSAADGKLAGKTSCNFTSAPSTILHMNQEIPRRSALRKLAGGTAVLAASAAFPETARAWMTNRALRIVLSG